MRNELIYSFLKPDRAMITWVNAQVILQILIQKPINTISDKTLSNVIQYNINITHSGGPCNGCLQRLNDQGIHPEAPH